MTSVLRILTGRLSRRSYVVGWFVPTLAIAILLQSPLLDNEPLVRSLGTLVLAVVVLAGDIPLGMARFRDGGISGWWYIAAGYTLALRLVALGWYVIFLPIFIDLEMTIGARMGDIQPLPSASRIVDTVIMIVLAMGVSWSFYRLVLRAGDREPNKYGPDPLARESVGGQHKDVGSAP